MRRGPGLRGEHRDDDGDLPRPRLPSPSLLETGETLLRVLQDLLDLLDRVPSPRQAVEQEASDLPLHGPARLDRVQALVDHPLQHPEDREPVPDLLDRKSTRLNSSHGYISYAVFCLKKKKP